MTTGWFGESWTSDQSQMITLSVVMMSIVGLCLLCWWTDIYRILPGWGPIRKFDADASEDMRFRQSAIHRHAASLEAGRLAQPQEKAVYGSIGRPTWGTCESGIRSSMPFNHPVLGPVRVRDGFDQTQKMRTACEWWGKDEQYFMAQSGVQAPPLRINEHYVSCTNNMHG
ncbi:unnamed protein product [Prorocentrum cordatum]|uniref:Uncharacterized protein n=1 Tax=Prorocentrum cordatum TaxID=2364126 RepID=A0ABN9PI95_9DINO|nr:unnamed protein product [Polarella glacialis]|mmetsp:Transcript_27774/g.72679  ORF Transcript_27774/g.72679 Transcript_27774/m.72679 type:complete len:170 (-) Transcript_27774:73-582(-)